ncbi:hypothetical protein [Nocardia brasiliensis]|uniref:Uncharacterized protein n=1 Tax=Nocardia brasiliensis (strain ATCC 700358 / HUJEG-1) TaxID=1133849 RepID=K0F1E3_NOCB7|nr:hypothetical protein [Nocardia brasiliensis]AFU02940.1 hypothetical protein O3I_024945 [Nocardia brasiliensis ATCC 700358]OCF86014.1 hypothetical protein AW168_33160 [Nocardia brasiliensis]
MTDLNSVIMLAMVGRWFALRDKRCCLIASMEDASAAPRETTSAMQLMVTVNMPIRTVDIGKFQAF